MNDELKDQVKQQSTKLDGTPDELKKWLQLLMENCASDTPNAHIYMQRAAAEVNLNVAQASIILVMMEEIITPIQTSKKLLKKTGDLAEVVFPMLIMAKLLSLMQEKLEA